MAVCADSPQDVFFKYIYKLWDGYNIVDDIENHIYPFTFGRCIYSKSSSHLCLISMDDLLIQTSIDTQQQVCIIQSCRHYYSHDNGIDIMFKYKSIQNIINIMDNYYPRMTIDS